MAEQSRAVFVWTGRLMARLIAADNGLGPSDQDPSKVHEAACKALNAPCTTSVPSDSSGQSVGGGANIGGALTVVFYLFVLALVAGLVYLIVRAVQRRSHSDTHADETSFEDDQPQTIIDRTTEPDQWRRQAAVSFAAGNYREALRCRYRALVGDLARDGVLDEIPGRTTGEERRQFADRRSPAQPAFNEATEIFDAVWYGAEAAGVAEHDRFVEREREVLTATAGRPHR